MYVLAIVLLVLVSLITLEWAYRHVRISREKGRASILTPDHPGPPSDAPHVTVFVAAKDEQENIGACLETMLAQDYPDFDIVVGDDRSEDATAEIVESFAERDDRVRLVSIDHLPDGWCGKNHAMHHAIATSQSEWMCMIDADCRQDSPRTLSTAMEYARERGADLLSVLPRHDMRTFWENIVQPIASGVMMIWFRPDLVNSPKSPHAYANGAFMLIKREAYDAVGGHEAVRDQVNEDMHMACRVKQAGLTLRVVQNAGLYRVRMYESLRTILRGWSRIFYGTFGTLKRLTASLLLLVFMGYMPLVAAVLGTTLGGVGAEPNGLWWAVGAAGCAGLVAQLTVMYRFYRLAGARGELCWSYLLGYAVTFVALVMAIGKLRRGATVTWRNTRYATSAQKG